MSDDSTTLLHDLDTTVQGIDGKDITVHKNEFYTVVQWTKEYTLPQMKTSNKKVRIFN